MVFLFAPTILPATSYHQITRFIQGYVDNEINLNPDDSCKATCSDYKKTRNYKCGTDTLCSDAVADHGATKCNGTVYNCEFMDGDLTVCPVMYSLIAFKVTRGKHVGEAIATI